MKYKIGGLHKYELQIPLTEYYPSCVITEYKTLVFTKNEIKWIQEQIRELKIR